jgi:hypothetical protein
MNGRTRSASEAQQIHDAETFELHGLISEDDDEDAPSASGEHQMGPKKATDEENRLIKE